MSFNTKDDILILINYEKNKLQSKITKFFKNIIKNNNFCVVNIVYKIPKKIIFSIKVDNDIVHLAYDQIEDEFYLNNEELTDDNELSYLIDDVFIPVITQLMTIWYGYKFQPIHDLIKNNWKNSNLNVLIEVNLINKILEYSLVSFIYHEFSGDKISDRVLIKNTLEKIKNVMWYDFIQELFNEFDFILVGDYDEFYYDYDRGRYDYMELIVY